MTTIAKNATKKTTVKTPTTKKSVNTAKGSIVTTKSGFHVKIPDYAMDDAELLDLLIEFDNGNYAAYPLILSKLLTAKDKARLYDHVRAPEGNVPLTKIGVELGDILKQLNGSKKK